MVMAMVVVMVVIMLVPSHLQELRKVYQVLNENKRVAHHRR